jgi:hypothetical protein
MGDSGAVLGISLSDALAGARGADKQTRIEWRDRIADYGVAAIDAISPWVLEPEYGAFAVRVIEAVGRAGERDAAIAALASVHRVAPTDWIRKDVDDALAALQPGIRKPRDGGERQNRLPARAGTEWPGFLASDFGRVKDTTWRRGSDRLGLVPLVLRPLRDLDSDFGSFPIYMSPEVHIADRDRYLQGGEWKQGWRASKLVIYAHGPTAEQPDVQARVAAGYYVEKGTGTDEYGPIDAALWDWPRFLDLLRDPIRRRPLETATAKHDLRVGDYFGGRFSPRDDVLGFVGRLEDGELVLRSDDERELGRGWNALLARLEGLPAGTWHDLQLWREWPADQAIEMGQPFALRELVPVMVDLARIYLDVIATVHPSDPS